MKKLLILVCVSSLSFACSTSKSYAGSDPSPGFTADKKFEVSEVAFIELKKTELEVYSLLSDLGTSAIKADEIVIAVPDNFASTSGKEAPGISHYKKAKKYQRPALNSKRWKDIYRRTSS